MAAFVASERRGVSRVSSGMPTSIGQRLLTFPEASPKFANICWQSSVGKQTLTPPHPPENRMSHPAATTASLPRNADAAPSTIDTDVLIVGAGPTGLTLATALCAQGI